MADQDDEVLTAVGRALARVGAGDRAGARRELEELWTQVGTEGDALHRCAVAHTLAELQDDPLAELGWDLRALDAGLAVDAEQLAAAQMPGSPAGLLPSLHLNVADVLLRLGRMPAALEHVALGTARLGALPPDGYRRMIEDGLERVRSAASAR